ncbi:MAG: hypothetical protein ACRER7_04600 [Gammaproteobacteria bacterium]
MHTSPDSVARRISVVTLQLIATLLGLIGTALVIVQALFWIPIGYANLAALILTACVPLIAAIVFAVVPRRATEDNARNYLLRAPMAWINLALPVLFTFLAMILIGISGSFDNFVGFALLLAANTGRNLRDFLRVLLLRAASSRP